MPDPPPINATSSNSFATMDGRPPWPVRVRKKKRKQEKRKGTEGNGGGEGDSLVAQTYLCKGIWEWDP
jgi:hypothetical protein